MLAKRTYIINIHYPVIFGQTFVTQHYIAGISHSMSGVPRKYHFAYIHSGWNFNGFSFFNYSLLYNVRSLTRATKNDVVIHFQPTTQCFTLENTIYWYIYLCYSTRTTHHLLQKPIKNLLIVEPTLRKALSYNSCLVYDTVSARHLVERTKRCFQQYPF